MTTAAAAKVHFETGTRAQAMGDTLMAQQEFARALDHDRHNAAAMNRLAMVLAQSNRNDAALLAAKRATQLDKLNSFYWQDYARLLGDNGRFREAIAALENAGDYLQRWQSLGLCHYSLGEFNQAIAAYDRALRIKSDDIDTIDYRGLALMGAGRYREGLIENKARWKYAAAHPFMHSAVPEWWGENLTGKTIAILHEQGFGDTLHFCRYLPLLRERFGAKRVVLSVRDSMIGLMKLSGLADEVVGIHEISGVEGIDCKSPMLSYPAFMDLTFETLWNGVYLKPPLRAPTLAQDKQFKIGLVWGGLPMYAPDRWRSMDPLEFLPLFERFDKVSWYSLQEDDRGAQLWQLGLNAFVTDLRPKLKDWLDTAALVNELDLVITVDTSVAHLVGGMGKRAWLLSPEASCWRWLTHERTDTPWYPSMRLFRQVKQGDWKPVISSVADALDDLVP